MRRACSRTSTDTAPYAFVPGSAKNRSATSRCTITHQDSSSGTPVSVSATSGVATLYGRLATSFRGSGSSPGMSRVRASPKARVTLPRSPSAVRRGASSLRSISTAWTCRTRSARKVVRTPRPGPTSRTTSPCSSPARRSMTPSTFGSTRKCCPYAFFGATRLTGRARTPSRRSRRCTPRALRHPRPGRRRGSRACGARASARSVGREPAAGRGTGCRSPRAGDLSGTTAADSRSAAAFGYVTFPAKDT